MYTPQQTAGMLQIATSTLRKYSALYAEYLSDAARRKQRRYTDSDVAVLKQISDLRSKGYSLEDIPKHLTRVEHNRPENSLAMIPAISAEFQAIHDQLARLREDQTTEIARLEKKLDELSAIVTEERKRGLISRLFGRK